MKVIVLGVGSMGSAACDHLARRGVEVLGIDQFQVPHERGSHHGESRMIRQSYYEHPDYVPLLLRAYDLWRDLEQRAACEILHETGGLYLGAPEGGIVAGALRAATQHGLAHQTLDATGIGERYPQFELPREFVGFYETRAGYLKPGNAIRAHAEQARQHGATILEGSPVQSWRQGAEGVEVRTADTLHQADRLIIAAGAWAAQCMADLGIPFAVTRQLLGWFYPEADAEQFRAGRFPCWFLESESPYGHYGFPLVEDAGTIKLALHKPGRAVDPDELTKQEISPGDIGELRAFLERYIPGAAGALAAAKLCMYANSPDQHFVLGGHPEHERVIIAAGFSGHGFKFSSVVGEILADLALDGSTSHPISLFDPGRFG